MRLFFILALLFAPLAGGAETGSFLLMHTNDLHDHVRPDYDGVGGITYVSGYVQSVREQRGDILLLDAGDVMEKGDLVAFRNKSLIMYEAMHRIGYDAIAPGNHDDVYGLEHLKHCDKITPNMAILCINLFDEHGGLLFPASKVFEVGGVKVGVIGMNRPRDEQSLNLRDSARAIAREAERLAEETHLIIVTVHEGAPACREMAEIAPMVGVWVSGHNHQALHKPIVLDNGALVLQAGCYAKYVGEVEIAVDLNAKKITEYNGRLVEMRHDTVPNDTEMLAWIREEEQRCCPEAARHLFTLEKPMGMLQLSYLAADALREASGADVAFLHAGQIMRDSLPLGAVDYNAIFRTGGQRAHDIVAVEVLGSLLEAYVGGLRRTGWGTTQWVGFRGGLVAQENGSHFVSNLEPDKTYRVVMAVKEWETRFARFFERHHTPQGASEAEHIGGWETAPVDTTFTDALVAYVERHRLDGATLADRAKDVIASTELSQN